MCLPRREGRGAGQGRTCSSIEGLSNRKKKAARSGGAPVGGEIDNVTEGPKSAGQLLCEAHVQEKGAWLHLVDPTAEAREVDSGLVPALRQSKMSYKEVLLRQSSPGHQGGKRCALTNEDGASSEVRRRDFSSCCEPKICVEGWQVVKPKRQRPHIAPQLDGLSQQHDERRRAFFFRRMKGLCFNCLASDHKVALCRIQQGVGVVADMAISPQSAHLVALNKSRDDMRATTRGALRATMP